MNIGTVKYMNQFSDKIEEWINEVSTKRVFRSSGHTDFLSEPCYFSKISNPYWTLEMDELRDYSRKDYDSIYSYTKEDLSHTHYRSTFEKYADLKAQQSIFQASHPKKLFIEGISFVPADYQYMIIPFGTLDKYLVSYLSLFKEYSGDMRYNGIYYMASATLSERIDEPISSKKEFYTKKQIQTLNDEKKAEEDEYKEVV